jgi:hypothetical protein
MSRALGNRDTPLKRIALNQHGIRNEEQKPVLGGPKIFVGDYIGPGDPGNDPPFTSASSPPWQNGFTYAADSPIWFAHGVDGETDMGGAYDLVTGSPVSGDVAFDMPLEWAAEAQELTLFAILTDGTGDPSTWKWETALQYINTTTGIVRIYWPMPIV